VDVLIRVIATSLRTQQQLTLQIPNPLTPKRRKRKQKILDNKKEKTPKDDVKREDKKENP